MPLHAPGRIPGLILGGTGSNAGKTVATLALLCALRARGLRAHAAKTGPDFIDTAFHAALTEAPAANLDVWMCGDSANKKPGTSKKTALAPGLARLFARMQASSADGRPPDILVVEGVMGLYDGGPLGAGCTAQLAALLNLPVLLALNVHGLGQSVAALAEGFLSHRPTWAGKKADRPGFAGLICTHVGGEKHKDILRQALAPVEAASGVPLLGLLPREGAPRLESRHLGLKEAREALPSLKRDTLAHWMEAHCDLDALLLRLGAPCRASSEPLKPHEALPQKNANPRPAACFFSPEALPPTAAPLRIKNRAHTRQRPRLGMAWDAAFSFCYADLPALLHDLGADIVFFSPLRDAAPPPGCHGLYFPGGYPELHARELAANTPMRAALHELAAQGLPMYGECGGYIYLMRSLHLDGQEYPMSGLLPLHCQMEERRAALGYRMAEALPGWPRPRNAGAAPLLVRGHEFHYGRLIEKALPPRCAPLWLLRDSKGALLGEEGCRCASVGGSWLHLYPEGALYFWQAWLERLARKGEMPPQAAGHERV